MGQEFEVDLEYSEFENFKYYCKINEINIVATNYLENIVCKIQVKDDKKEKLLGDFKLKKVNLINIIELGKKYI